MHSESDLFVGERRLRNTPQNAPLWSTSRTKETSSEGEQSWFPTRLGWLFCPYDKNMTDTTVHFVNFGCPLISCFFQGFDHLFSDSYPHHTPTDTCWISSCHSWLIHVQSRILWGNHRTKSLDLIPKSPRCDLTHASESMFVDAFCPRNIKEVLVPHGTRSIHFLPNAVGEHRCSKTCPWASSSYSHSYRLWGVWTFFSLPIQHWWSISSVVER